LKHMLGSV